MSQKSKVSLFPVRLCVAIIAGLLAIQPAVAADKPKSVAILPDFVDRAPAASLTIVDNRPKEDIDTDTASFWITSCRFGVTQYGDDAMAPSKLALLRRDLEDNLGTPLPPVSITITRYRVILNASKVAWDRTEGNQAIGVQIMGSMMRAHDCPDFAPDSLGPNSPLIVAIEGTVNGQAISVRIVRTTEYEYFHFRYSQPGREMFAAMRQAHAEFIDKVRVVLGMAPLGDAEKTVLTRPLPANAGPRLAGADRESFVQDSIRTCLRTVRSDRPTRALPKATQQAYCECYSNEVADQIGQYELATLTAVTDNPGQLEAMLRTRIDEAKRTCWQRVLPAPDQQPTANSPTP